MSVTVRLLAEGPELAQLREAIRVLRTECGRAYIATSRTRPTSAQQVVREFPSLTAKLPMDLALGIAHHVKHQHKTGENLGPAGSAALGLRCVKRHGGRVSMLMPFGRRLRWPIHTDDIDLVPEGPVTRMCFLYEQDGSICLEFNIDRADVDLDAAASPGDARHRCRYCRKTETVHKLAEPIGGLEWGCWYCGGPTDVERVA